MTLKENVNFKKAYYLVFNLFIMKSMWKIIMWKEYMVALLIKCTEIVVYTYIFQ